jgi:UDP-3-O-[3-hydroxymyristoyl] glucosamine N-acyltransferase
MTATVLELARLVGGEVVGDEGQAIHGTGVLDGAGAGEITLLDKAEKVKLLAGSSVAAVVVPRGVALPPGLTAIVVDNVHAAFTRIVTHFRPSRGTGPMGVHPDARISPDAQIGAGVTIHAGAIIDGDVAIGDRTTIYPGVHLMPGCRIAEDVTIFAGAVLYENTIVGPRVMIHAGAVVGCYGFGYTLRGGRHERTAQLGHVEIQADVEVGACTTIDRGTYGPTVIGEGTKIDNQVQIAHNCRIGRHNLICAQVGIAGSTTTGDYVVMAGQVGVRDHVHIGDRAILGAKAGVSNDVPGDSTHFGIPAVPERVQKLRFAAIAKLPEMRRQLRQMQHMVDALARQSGLAPVVEPDEQDHEAA